MLAYCRDDVRVLRLRWLQFTHVLKQITGGCLPGVRNVTLASFTNLFWCTTIQWNVVGMVPCRAYCQQVSQSKVGMRWVRHRDLFVYGGRLNHAWKDGGEKVLRLKGRDYSVDFLDAETNTIGEFCGCYYHSCLRCFAGDSKGPGSKTMKDLNGQTLNRMNFFQEQGFKVEWVWECDWLKEVEKADAITKC